MASRWLPGRKNHHSWAVSTDIENIDLSLHALSQAEIVGADANQLSGPMVEIDGIVSFILGERENVLRHGPRRRIHFQVKH